MNQRGAAWCGYESGLLHVGCRQRAEIGGEVLMAKFNVYAHPTQGIQIVKGGFSWPVFAICSAGLGCVYFAVRKRWVLALIWLLIDDVGFAVGVLGLFAGTAVHVYLMALLHLAFMSMIPAFKANAWIGDDLVASGFALQGSVVGATAAAAKAVFETAKNIPTAASAHAIRAEIILHHNGGVKRIPFAKEVVIIGRKPDCDIVIDETYISGRHAKLERRSGHYFVTDIMSTNGTLVNGRPISAETWISENDSVQLGEVTLGIAEAG